MSHDSMAWLGCALWLADMGYPADVAAKAAGPILAAFKEAASDGV